MGYSVSPPCHLTSALKCMFFSRKSILKTDSAIPKWVWASYRPTGLIRPVIIFGAMF